MPIIVNLLDDAMGTLKLRVAEVVDGCFRR